MAESDEEWPTDNRRPFFLYGGYLFRIDSVFHAITFTFNDDRFAMMEDTVEDGGGEGCIVVEDRGPLFERFV